MSKNLPSPPPFLSPSSCIEGGQTNCEIGALVLQFLLAHADSIVNAALRMRSVPTDVQVRGPGQKHSIKPNGWRAKLCEKLGRRKNLRSQLNTNSFTIM